MKTELIEDIYPLSPTQQGMLFHDLYDSEPGAYIEQLTWTFCGDLDVAALEHAWQRVSERHSVLRTIFLWEELDEPLQVVYRDLKLTMGRFDWHGLSATEQQDRLESFLEMERKRGFDLSVVPLMRVNLITLTENLYQFVWTYHHLLLDGWSVSLLLNELFAFYDAFCDGRDLQIKLGPPYRNYIAWLQGQDLRKAEEFWRQNLKDFNRPTRIALERNARVEANHTSFGEYKFKFTTTTTASLQSFAREHQLTLNTILQGGWAFLLSRYCGHEDVVFGTSVSGRPPTLAGIESMIGMFINTLPVRVRVSREASLLPWLQKLHSQQVEMQQYEFSPLVQIQKWSDVPADQPLFNILFGFENYPTNGASKGWSRSSNENESDVQITGIRSVARTNYPLNVMAGIDSSLWVKFLYDRSSYDSSAIEMIAGHFERLLTSIVAEPEQRISSLPLLSRAERQQLLVEWNQTERPYPRQQCMHELFAAQVKMRPGALAVVSEQTRLSYQELNQRANRLAHYLRRRGVGVEDRVGVLLERSAEMVVALLAVLKAGACYLPLEVSWPAARLAYMLADAEVRLLLTEAKWQTLAGTTPMIALDRERQQLDEESDTDPAIAVSPQNLAYVIYTSGSTGLPKAVAVQHHSLVNLSTWHREIYNVNEKDRAALMATPSFDASVWELWPYLSAGASVYIPDEANATTVPKLLKRLEAQSITICFLPTPLAEIVLDDPWLVNLSLRILLTGGDKLQRVPHRAPPFALINHYGPTESTVVTTLARVDFEEAKGITPPIGKPIANTQVYILDSQLEPVPLGVIGELCISGEGLARGYLNQPALTAERFIPHPFSRTGGERLYRTGDLARYLPNGDVAFAGRADRQVKLRGFRIELEEIEATLLQHETVREAVVVKQENKHGNSKLVAFVVSRNSLALPIDKLRSFLRRKLPDYMIPTFVVPLDTLPVTRNGKVDRDALANLESLNPELNVTYVAPRNKLEETIVTIWQELLHVDTIGIHDNFLEKGGDSVLAIQITSRLRDALQMDLSVRLLFDAPTPAELAEEIAQHKEKQTDHQLDVIKKTDRPGEQMLVDLARLSDKEVDALIHELMAEEVPPNE